MRLNKGTLIILVILLVIIAAAALLLQGEPEEAESTDGTPANVLLFEGIEAGSVEAMAMTIDNGTGTETPSVETRYGVITLVLERDEDNGWVVGADTTAPPSQPLNLDTVNQRLDTLLNMRYRDRFEADDLAPYGLSETQDEISFTAEGVMHRLRIGDVNVSGTQYYALLDDDESTVYLLTSKTTVDNLLTMANEPPIIPAPTPSPVPVLTLPGPIFSGFNQVDVQMLTISDHSTGDAITFIRDEETQEWRIDGEEGAVDQTRVNVAVSDFGSLVAVDGLPGDDLEPLGLTEPVYTITAQQGESRQMTLHIGGFDVTETRYYALVDDFEEVAVIPVEDISLVLSLLDEPPLLPEVEATAEATEAAESGD